jgi:hypothetical protein
MGRDSTSAAGGIKGGGERSSPPGPRPMTWSTEESCFHHLHDATSCRSLLAIQTFEGGVAIPTYRCPGCGNEFPSPFRSPCATCGFDIGHLSGKSLSDFQKRKWDKHTELLTGNSISLYGGAFNASFDHNGTAKLDDLLRFTLGFGEMASLPARGSRSNDIRIAFIPETIGSGTSIYAQGLMACSGICVVSPASLQFGHPFPVLDNWVNQTFLGQASTCRFCGTSTSFGVPFCPGCFARNGGDWTRFL